MHFKKAKVALAIAHLDIHTQYKNMNGKGLKGTTVHWQ